MSVPRRVRAALATAATLGTVTSIAVTAVPASPAEASQSHHARASSPAHIAARGAELADASTGKVLWTRGRQVERPIASITKVMTALVVIRAGDLGRKIRITQAEVNYVVNGGASGAGLIAGDVLTTRQLLYAMLLPSGADAAMALAISYGPGWPAFVRKMNRLARRLHLNQTHFSNFDGLPWPTARSDYSTPGNLVHLGLDAMAEPVFRAVVHRKFYWLPAGHGHHAYLWRNRNYLLRTYPGAIGIKPGWTPAAGQCLLFEAVYGKRTLIGVALDSSPVNRNGVFYDATRMLNWGFGGHVPLTAVAPPGGSKLLG